jgi:hypothetical protein
VVLDAINSSGAFTVPALLKAIGVTPSNKNIERGNDGEILPIDAMNRLKNILLNYAIL